MPLPSAPIQTRGASDNPPNRFERLSLEPDPDWYDPDEPVPATHFYRDTTSTIITYNDSPDVGFSASVNPYRGCEHGCIYCYARPYHEFLGFSAGLDFETKITVKEAAPELLRRELASPRWQPQAIAMSGVTDCYQPVERRLQLTRRCLEVLAEFRNPVGIVTKNLLVTRDVDVLHELARHHAAAVFVSVPTLDPELRKIMEPRTSPPSARLTAIRTLAEAGIPVGVLIAPVIPALTDHELPRIIAAAAEAGASFAGCVSVRLPLTVAPLFERWLEQHLPAKKEKVLNRIRAIRGGQLNDPNFGTRMKGEGIFAEQIEQMFTVACRKAGLNADGPELSTAAFRRPEGAQLSLFS